MALLAADGENRVFIAGKRHKATNYRIKVELGGLAGVFGPIVGKQPADQGEGQFTDHQSMAQSRPGTARAKTFLP